LSRTIDAASVTPDARIAKWIMLNAVKAVSALQAIVWTIRLPAVSGAA
jgi:hypothetical protein